MIKQWLKKYWYNYWGKYHKEDDNTCLICGHPAYRRWDKKYSGYIGFCTECDSNWRES